MQQFLMNQLGYPTDIFMFSPSNSPPNKFIDQFKYVQPIQSVIFSNQGSPVSPTWYPSSPNIPSSPYPHGYPFFLTTPVVYQNQTISQENMTQPLISQQQQQLQTLSNTNTTTTNTNNNIVNAVQPSSLISCQNQMNKSPPNTTINIKVVSPSQNEPILINTNNNTNVNTNSFSIEIKNKEIIESDCDESDGELNEIVEESKDGRWSKRNESVTQRDVPGIDCAYLAMDTEYGFEVVWNEIKLSGGKKFKNENLVNDETEIDRVFKNLISLNHSNIVKFHDYWIDTRENDPRIIFITEYMSSGSLKQFLRKAKRTNQSIKKSTWKRWCVELLTALDYMHKCDPPVVHGDLSCDTIFIQHNGLIKIGCIAPDIVNTHVKTCIDVNKWSRHMHYMAPELKELLSSNSDSDLQVNNSPIDIYAFGIVALEMFNLECGATNENQTVTPELIKQSIESLDDKQKDFINKCLQTDPKKRPTAKDLLFHPLLFEVPSLKLFAAHKIIKNHNESLNNNSFTKSPEFVIASIRDYEFKFSQLSAFDVNKYLEDVKNGLYPLIVVDTNYSDIQKIQMSCLSTSSVQSTLSPNSNFSLTSNTSSKSSSSTSSPLQSLSAIPTAEHFEQLEPIRENQISTNSSLSISKTNNNSSNNLISNDNNLLTRTQSPTLVQSSTTQQQQLNGAIQNKNHSDLNSYHLNSDMKKICDKLNNLPIDEKNRVVQIVPQENMSQPLISQQQQLQTISNNNTSSISCQNQMNKSPPNTTINIKVVSPSQNEPILINNNTNVNTNSFSIEIKNKEIIESDCDESDGELNEIVEESRDGRWSKRNESVTQRDVPGIDCAYLAMDTEYGFEVVWNEIKLSGGKKFKNENLVNDETEIDRVFKNLISLNHSNIVKFHDYWIDTRENDPRIIFITEYMSSGSLKQFLRKAKRTNQSIKKSTWKRWCVELLTALDYMHKCDPPVVHGDLSCDTIFIQHNGLIKIGCIAPDIVNTHVKTCIDVNKWSRHMHYMAPELKELLSSNSDSDLQVNNSPVDIYAFGMVALEMFNLECGATNENQTVTPELIKQSIESLDDKQKDFINKCLQTDPKKRPTAKDLLFHPLLFEVPSLKLFAAHKIIKNHNESLNNNSFTKSPEFVIASIRDYEFKFSQLSAFDVNKYLEDVKNGLYPLIVVDTNYSDIQKIQMSCLSTSSVQSTLSPNSNFSLTSNTSSKSSSSTSSPLQSLSAIPTAEHFEQLEPIRENQISTNSSLSISKTNNNSSNNLISNDNNLLTRTQSPTLVQSSTTQQQQLNGAIQNTNPSDLNGDINSNEISLDTRKILEKRQAQQISTFLTIDETNKVYQLTVSITFDDRTFRTIQSPVNETDTVPNLAEELIAHGLVNEVDRENLCLGLSQVLKKLELIESESVYAGHQNQIL